MSLAQYMLDNGLLCDEFRNAQRVKCSGNGVRRFVAPIREKTPIGHMTLPTKQRCAVFAVAEDKARSQGEPADRWRAVSTNEYALMRLANRSGIPMSNLGDAVVAHGIRPVADVVNATGTIDDRWFKLWKIVEHGPVAFESAVAMVRELERPWPYDAAELDLLG